MSPITIADGRIFNPESNFVYELLSYLEPGLMLDVGAAIGGFSKVMSANSPESRVMAFEPFPGNWPMLDTAVAGNPSIVVDKRAASDVDGTSRLYVSQVVSGSEEGWAGKAGYSSAGTLVDEADKRYERAIDVETVRLDTLFDEQVRFMKIDVQGTELAVINGAASLLQRNMIDLMWVEFSGELDILTTLADYGFVMFDSPYLMIPRTDPPDESAWEIVGTKNLSSGRKAYVAWPHEYPRSAEAYCDWLNGWKRDFIIQNDMTCVHRSVVNRYLSAASQALEARGF